jgi:hypothetical protein
MDGWTDGWMHGCIGKRTEKNRQGEKQRKTGSKEKEYICEMQCL